MTVPEHRPIEEQFDALQESVSLLTDLTTDLTRRQNRQIIKTQRTVKITVVGLILDLLLSLAGVFLINQGRDNAERLDKQQQQIVQIQEKTSSDVLCPLWIRFLRSYNPDSPAAKQDPQNYEESFKVIEEGAKTLGCSQTTRGIP